MKKYFLFFLPAFFYSGYVPAQDIKTLLTQLQYLKEDTTGIKLLNDIASAFYTNYENDSCTKYATQALKLADKLINSDAAKRSNAYYISCIKLKAQAIGNIGNAMYFEDVNKSIDTLNTALKLWKKTGDETGMASVYRFIADVYTSRNDYMSALKYLDSSAALHGKTGNKHEISYVYYNIALNKRYLGNFGDALENNVRALAIAETTKDTNLVTLALLSNGFIYMYVKDFKEALKSQQAALKIFKTTRDSFGIATVYNDMGVTAWRAGNLNEALKDHKTALMIRKQIKDYVGVGNSCSYISQILQLQGKYEEALTNNIEASKYAKLSGNMGYILDAYNDAGNIYLKLHDNEKALKKFDTALQLSSKNNDRLNQAKAMRNISEIFLSQGKPKEVIAWLNKAAAITDTSDFISLKVIYVDLSRAYSNIGDYKNAYNSSMKYKQFSDSVANNEKTEKLTSITNQLEFQNKQTILKVSQDKLLAVKQSEIERQKLVQNITIAGLFIVVALAIILFIRFAEKKKLNTALEQTLSNLRSAQSQLVQSEKMASLGELTAGIAHEIQNPLNFVNNFSEVNAELITELVDEVGKGNTEEVKVIAEDIKQNLDKINYHGRRADAIVKGMLQHSRAGSGQKELTDINKLADEYLRLSYHGMRAKDKSFNADFKTDFDETIGKINVVPQDIGRVLLNLFNNAFYAVSKSPHPPDLSEQALKGSNAYEPTVSVSTKKLDSKVLISVKDNGNGIPQSIVDKIFQPFFTTKPTGQGTGLGLSLAYDIIKAHAGEIKVETREGNGSEFVIVLQV